MTMTGTRRNYRVVQQQRGQMRQRQMRNNYLAMVKKAKKEHEEVRAAQK